MQLLQDIKDAIARLSADELTQVERWFYTQIFPKHDEGGREDTAFRVEEPAAAYKTDPAPRHMSVDEYLRFEENSPVRHEYVAGEIFAMSGASLRHNAITRNLLQAISAHLGNGNPCQLFFLDVKVHIRTHRHEFLYYPDLAVVCGQQQMDSREIERPKLVIEVLSPSTERTDRGEKAFNYRHIAALEEYVLVAQTSMEVTLHRRGEDWAPRRLAGPDAVAVFQSLDLSLPLPRIYQDT